MDVETTLCGSQVDEIWFDITLDAGFISNPFARGFLSSPSLNFAFGSKFRIPNECFPIRKVLPKNCLDIPHVGYSIIVECKGDRSQNVWTSTIRNVPQLAHNVVSTSI